MQSIKKIAIGVGALAALGLGGAAIAGATQGNDPNGHLSSSEQSQARDAALTATKGGEVNAMERDGEKGATFEVEVTKPDGTTVDVRLDEAYNVVAIDGDHEDSGSESGNEAG